MDKPNELMPYCLQESDKVTIRENIIEAVIHSPDPIRVQLIVCVRTISQQDFPDKWPGIVDKVHHFIQTNDINSWYGVLQAFYQLCKIYKIVDLDSNKCYVGSTCEPTLARRLANSDYKQYLQGKGSNNISSFIILEMDDYDIVLLEKYARNSKDELFAHERYYSQLLPCVNKNKNQGLKNERIQKTTLRNEQRTNTKAQRTNI